MSSDSPNRSVLLQLARDSIQEVFQAENSIDKVSLLQEHSLLKQSIQTTINLYIDKKLRGSSKSHTTNNSLLQEIIINAKRAAFEDTDFSPLTTSEYLNCELEIILQTPDGEISERDPSILQ